MKKQILFLMAGGLLAFASCNTGNTGGYTEEQVDAIVNERVALIQAELEAKNDSLIHALALEKADSIIAASKGAAVPARKPSAPAAPAKKVEEPKQSTSSNKWGDNQKNDGQPSSKSKWDNNQEKKDEPSSKSKWGN